MTPPIKVFISYTHDSPDHDSRVLSLSNALRQLGFDSDLDQYHINERWPHWMEERIDWADFVVIVCTETYLRRWKLEETPGIGLGAQWESLLARQLLYESPRRNDKFVPVIFSSTDQQFIPKPLADVTRITVGNDLGHLDRLRSRLLGIPPAEMPPIRTSLAPIALADGFFGHKPVSANASTVTTDAALSALRDKNESVSSNLFPIDYPEQIIKAQLKRKKGIRIDDRIELIWQRLKKSDGPPSNYLIDERTIYSFAGFETAIWNELFQTGVLEEERKFPSKAWAASE